MKEGVRTVAVEAPAIAAQSAANITAVLTGLLRVLSFEEFSGHDTGADLLALNNRACGEEGYMLSGEDIITIGNGSAVIMWLKSQVRVVRDGLTEIVRSEATIAGDGQPNGTTP